MRPIDFLSSRYYSIKPKGRDGGANRWRAWPVAAAAILLLMSLTVLLPAMVFGGHSSPAPVNFTAVPGVAKNTIDLNWDVPSLAVTSFEYCLRTPPQPRHVYLGEYLRLRREHGVSDDTLLQPHPNPWHDVLRQAESRP